MKKIATWLVAIMVALSLANPVWAHTEVDMEGHAEAEAELEGSGELPRGIQHAPGIQKRIERGKGLPPGIAKKIDRNNDEEGDDRDDEDERDLVAPVLSPIMVIDRTEMSARVLWATNERADSRLFVNTTSPVVTSGTASAVSAEFTLLHNLALGGLQPGITYFYVVSSADASGNVSFSQQGSFITEPAPPILDTRAPDIKAQWVDHLTQVSARLHWVTDEKASGKVLVSTMSPVLESESRVYVTNDLSRFHVMDITGLVANTAYFYTIIAVDASGNVKTLSGQSFATLSTDVEAPKIWGPFVIRLTKDSARIIWATDERADTRFWFHTKLPVKTDGAPVMSTSTLSRFHSVTVSGLASSTLYYYVVGSADASGNLRLSAPASFTTEAR